MSWKWHRQVLEVRCFDNQSTCSGRRAEDRGSVFVCPRLSVFYYEGFSSRTDGRKFGGAGEGEGWRQSSEMRSQQVGPAREYSPLSFTRRA
jgi:hypothetical protein